VYHVHPVRRAAGAPDASFPCMSTAVTEWNLQHIHPHGSWWQYVNDRPFGVRTQIALGVMALISTALTIWAVLVA
jgi:hypothetical protein